MSFYTDLEKALLEAIEMEKGNLPVIERKDMPSKTYYVPDFESDLINQMIGIRKDKNISQTELASMVGSRQQVISRIEKMESIPSLKMFTSLINALGYEVRIVKAENKTSEIN